MTLWEIFVPCVRPDGRFIRTRCHRVWDAKVKAITGGLTIMPPTITGYWVSPEGGMVEERMIPVRVACTESQMDRIADFTAAYYEQQAIIYYEVSNKVIIKHYGANVVRAINPK